MYKGDPLISRKTVHPRNVGSLGTCPKDRFIERHGYEAVLWENQGSRAIASDVDGHLLTDNDMGKGLSPETILNSNSEYKELYKGEEKKKKEEIPQAVAGYVINGGKRTKARSVRPENPPPDVIFHMRLAAVACGLGELGMNGLLLTKEFGPYQRLAYIFTDAELEPDPLYNGDPLCVRCRACARACPGHCLNPDQIRTVMIGEKKIETYQIDQWGCFYHYSGGNYTQHPMAPLSAYDELPVSHGHHHHKCAPHLLYPFGGKRRTYIKVHIQIPQAA